MIREPHPGVALTTLQIYFSPSSFLKLSQISAATTDYAHFYLFHSVKIEHVRSEAMVTQNRVIFSHWVLTFTVSSNSFRFALVVIGLCCAYQGANTLLNESA